ncbi:MAG: hypothetical protein P0Y65_05755 [Candidatus Devosia phytovorans]|uniref:Uncharacterized protein n=1 Tax=Candidatus Devosia phytovorans TaxID=3121372 RepID=A0AAJ5VXK3_9HYPH|nr:hypothetical protein [Devosia sp.]WEK05760.1 MAG: hypothetical protein P0Y65_05755 [Devosia sp.]
MSDEKKTKLRADYTELFGKAPFNGWDEAELQKRIDAKLAGQEPGKEPAETDAKATEPTPDPYPSQADLDKMRSGNFDNYKSR